MNNLPLPPMAYITRMNYQRSAKAWWVRFVTTHKAKSKLIAHKLFKDSDHIDGKQEALFFAQEWRDFTYQDLLSKDIIKGYRDINGNGIPPVYRDVKPNNTSGIVGVERNDFIYCKNVNGTAYNIHCFVWKATWVEYDIFNGQYRRRPRSKTFSITRWGEDVAFEKAVNHRKQMEKFLMSERHIKIRNKYMIKDRKRKFSYPENTPLGKQPCTKKICYCNNKGVCLD